LRFNEQLARFVEPNDLIQEVLIKVHRNIRSYQEREDGSFEAWLSTIAANCVVDAARHYKRHKRGGTTLRVDDHPKSSNESLDTIWDWICEDSRLPEHSVRRAEARGALQVCLSELNPAQREAVVAHYFEHLDVKEIAIRMGRTPGAVRELLRRAQNQLRELMGSASVWLSGR
jgi:RNA polymerase sigma-70 factor (subfamily 1)